MLNNENILGFQVIQSSLEKCIENIIILINNNSGSKFLACINPHSIVISQNDKKFEEALLNSDLNIPDGAGIIFASKIFGGNIRERITGSDIFFGLHKVLNQKGGFSCFLLGSTEETLNKISDKMAQDFPNVKIVGTYSPPFKEEFTEEENQVILEAVNKANPDVLWVAMTAPKQEKWVCKNRDKLNAKVIAAVGAAFDFYAGTIKRSSPFWQKLGLEWLPRLIREPRRLWRRNLISTPMFLFFVLKEKFLNKKE